MRKFWKLGLIVGIVAFMAGCSNLWDYVPPPRVDNTPVSSDGASGGGGGGGGGGKPSGGSGSGPTRKVLTFNIRDVSGTTQEVKITVNANVDKVPLRDIEAAFNSQYPGLKPPFGVDLKWFQSGTPVTDPGTQYADNMTFTIDYDFPPGNKNYTVTLSTGNAGGKREFVTTDSDKPLSDILDKVGLAGPDYKPANPKPGWTFDHWEKVDSPNTTIDPATDATPQSSGTNFVAVYNVDYTIKIGTNTYTVKVPVAAPNEGATWADILAAAKADPQVLLAVGSVATKLDAMLWEDNSGKAADSTKRYPANTAFTGENAIRFNVGGQTVKVPVGAGETSATWEKIAAAAKRDGINVDKPAVPSDLSSGVFAEWQKTNGSQLSDGSYSEGAEFKPAFEVSYSISDGYTSYQHKEKVLEGTNTKKKLSDIFNLVNTDNSNAVPSNGSTVKAKIISPTEKVAFDGWRVTTPDGVTKIIRSSEIDGMTASNFPAGTKIKPNGIYQLFVDKGWETDGVGMEFTWFQGGQGGAEFTQVGDFYIANTEITREQWKKVMSYQGKGNDSRWLHNIMGKDVTDKNTKNQWNYAIEKSEDNAVNYAGNKPMDRVSWYDAIMFCNKLSLCNGRSPYYYFEYEGKTYDKFDGGEFDFFNKLNEIYEPTYNHQPKYANGEKVQLWEDVIVHSNESSTGFRLPSSDYWRYAAHGGKKVMRNGREEWLYPTYSGTTGSTVAALAEVAWCTDGGSMKKAQPVGTKKGDNPLRDMTGNVWEWTDDKYDLGTRLYIGGPYDVGSVYQSIDLITKNDAFRQAMWSVQTVASTGEKVTVAGSTGDRSTMGIRVIVYGNPGENYEDYFD